MPYSDDDPFVAITAGEMQDPIEDGDRDPIWDSVLPRTPPAASPSALPGMYANEQYTSEQKHALFVFRYLLVFVAALESFAHGANDTANATGAHAAL